MLSSADTGTFCARSMAASEIDPRIENEVAFSRRQRRCRARREMNGSGWTPERRKGKAGRQF